MEQYVYVVWRKYRDHRQIAVIFLRKYQAKDYLKKSAENIGGTKFEIERFRLGRP